MYLFNCELEKYTNIWFAHQTSNFMEIILFRVNREKKACQFICNLRREKVTGDIN